MSIVYDLITPPLRALLTSIGRRRLPTISGTLKLPGLSAPVEVLRDRWGVPHIYAAAERDVYTAQGYVHAQERLWQMELNRRTANGRLSEAIGKLALDTDRTALTFGFRRLGEADWANANPKTREVIEAYAAGVNAYLSSPEYRAPVEFTLLGLRPQPWTAVDSLAFSRVMIWQLSHAWYGELLRAWMIEKVGARHAADLEIEYPRLSPVALPDGIEFNLRSAKGALRAARGPFLNRAMGSNAWTLAGWRTTTGMPFLCNDMHLALSLPGLWFENQLTAGRLNVGGVSLPGLPMVLVGHNDRIAWGMTLAFTDCEDLFVEQIDDGPSPRSRSGKGWKPVQVIEEQIPVKGAKQPHTERILVTHHGPVISDVVGASGQRLAVCSMALRPSPAIAGWHELNLARGWDGFVAAMKLIEAPQLNVAYADVEGNIGYWVTGKVPIRARGDGRTPAPGYSGDHEWIGEVPFNKMPHAFNPRRGLVVTTNHKIVRDRYPYWLGNVYANGYRAQRIEQVLTSREKVGLDEFRAIHIDYTCLPGIEFVGLLQGFSTSDPRAGLALELLGAWDGVLSAETVGGTVYEVTRMRLVRNLLTPGLGPELTTRVMGQGFHPVLLAAHEFQGHDTVAMLRILRDPKSWWLQQAGGKQEVLERSLIEAIDWLRVTLGPDPSRWQWGRIHRAPFDHALGLQKPLDRIFSRGPAPIGGDTDTPCQTAFSPENPYDNRSWSPSFRQIIDLQDLSRSLVMTVPGQSGRLGSPHYDDRIEPWCKGEYHPMLWTRPQVEKEVEGRLLLEP
jgi:penicillin G amidase